MEEKVALCPMCKNIVVYTLEKPICEYCGTSLDDEGVPA